MDNSNTKTKRHTALKIFLAMIITGIVLVVIGYLWFENTKDKYRIETESFDKEIPVTDIDNLEFDTGVGRVYIKSTTDNFITINAVDVPRGYYKFSTDNNTFSIDTVQAESKKNIIGMLNFKDNYQNTKLTVYIPQGEYNRLKINAGVGETHIDTITCKTADIDQGIGLCVYDNLTVKGKATMDCGIGDTRIINADFQDTDIQSGIGKVTFSGKINGNLNIDGGIGDTDINIDGFYNDYKIKGSTENVNISKSSDDKSSAEKHTIKADTGIGSIKLNFR